MADYQHSLQFERDMCDGCMSCLRACPTAAVRVRCGRAVKLADRCIDCGECIRACPRGAIVPLTVQLADLSRFKCRIAIPSPALYTQFDTEILPGIIFAALENSGFDAVECLSPACDAVTMATEIYLSRYRGQFPLISSFCPTVVRLIQVKYPELVDQLLPVVAPREISARDAKRRTMEETGLPLGEIGAIYITPCPAKIVSILEHPGMAESNLDSAISISDLYPTLAVAVSKVGNGDFRLDGGETASGVSWAVRGRFPRSLPAEDTLYVAGLRNVMRILDDIEKGKLRRYSYIECQACSEGCVGGCLTIENPYVARGRLIKLRQRLPDGPAVVREEIERRFREGEFLMDEPLLSRPLQPLDEDISVAIRKMKERDKIVGELPGIDCGACGAPTCRAFAEDVVVGDVERALCVFSWHREVFERIDELARLVSLQREADGGRR